MPPARPPLPKQGSTNLSLVGITFGSPAFTPERLPGECGRDKDYIWPEPHEYTDYYDHGFNTYRIHVRWERLQNTALGELNPEEIARLDAGVDAANQFGGSMVIVLHNSGRYYPRDGRPIAPAAFADLWGRLAARYRGRDGVAFELMNHFADPQPGVPVALRLVNAALAAIRDAGFGGRVLINLGGYLDGQGVGVCPWGLPQLDPLDEVDDPGHHWLLAVQRPLLAQRACVPVGVPVPCVVAWRDALGFFTSELRSRRRRAVLTDFGIRREHLVPQQDGSPHPRAELGRSTLAHLNGNRDVWEGWYWFAAGPWWPATDPFDLTPDAARGDHASVGLDFLRPWLRQHNRDGAAG